MLTVLEAPAAEPVSLAQVKLHCRVDETVGDADDALLAAYLAAARAQVEQLTGRALVPRTLRYAFDAFPDGYSQPAPRFDVAPGTRAAFYVELPAPPLIGVDRVDYYDAAGVAQALDPSGFVVVADRDPGRLLPVGSWPAVRAGGGAVAVEYRAGYVSAENPSDPAAGVPEPLKQAVLLLVGHFYANREASVVGTSAQDLPLGVEALVRPFVLYPMP